MVFHWSSKDKNKEFDIFIRSNSLENARKILKNFAGDEESSLGKRIHPKINNYPTEINDEIGYILDRVIGIGKKNSVYFTPGGKPVVYLTSIYKKAINTSFLLK